MNIYPEQKKGIAWTDATWNPVTGCTKVSDECKHCYAERLFKRPYPGRKFTDVKCHPERLMQPLKVKRPLKIFVNSMSDLFHESVPDKFIDQVFAVMALSHSHTFQILTKRPERMREYINDDDTRARLVQEILAINPNAWDETTLFEDGYDADYARYPAEACWPLDNVWLGISAGTQAAADERIPLLLETEVAMRFVSAEPLLEPIKFQALEDIDWVIVGGESESWTKARPCALEWIGCVVKQCKETDMPVFVKQLGSRAVTIQYTNPNIPMSHYSRALLGEGLALHDKKGANPAEWPKHLRIQEFPR